MSKGNTKQAQKQLNNPFLTLNDMELKGKICAVSTLDTDEATILKNLRAFLLKNPTLSNLSVKDGKEFGRIAYDVVALGNIGNNSALSDSIGVREYKIMATSLCNDLIREYDCKTPSEKATAQIIANAYIRIMKYSRRLDAFNDIDYLSFEKNGFYSMISRELDRAERQYISALGILRQMKQPQMQVNIKTNTAFIADKQQLNLNNQTNEKVNG